MTNAEIIKNLEDYIEKNGQFSWPLDCDYHEHMKFVRFRREHEDKTVLECAELYLEKFKRVG